MKSDLEARNSPQGGDVMGTFKIDVSQGKSLEAAKASIDPGYSLKSTMNAGYLDPECLIHGYIDNGIGVGEGMPQGGKKIG